MAVSVAIGWLIACLFLSLFFSGMEVAFASSDKLQYAVSKKNTGGFNFMLNNIYSHPRQFLATLVIAKVMLFVLIIYFALIISAHYLFPLLENELLLFLLFIVMVSFIILLTDEFLPRTIFQKNANFWVNLFVFPAYIFYILFYPIARLFLSISKGVLRIVGIRSPEAGNRVFSRVDLDSFVRKSINDMSKEREVDSEVKIFRNALDFSSMKIRDCMVPRAEIVAVSIDTDPDTLKDKFIETGISRILVYKDDIDNILGYIHMWEIFTNPQAGRTTWLPFHSYLRACRLTSL